MNSTDEKNIIKKNELINKYHEWVNPQYAEYERLQAEHRRREQAEIERQKYLKTNARPQLIEKVDLDDILKNQ